MKRSALWQKYIEPIFKWGLVALLMGLTLQGLASTAPLFELPEWWFPICGLVAGLLALRSRVESLEREIMLHGCNKSEELNAK